VLLGGVLVLVLMALEAAIAVVALEPKVLESTERLSVWSADDPDGPVSQEYFGDGKRWLIWAKT
jgi:hypothetical protein